MTFQARLRHIMQVGNLRVADLARWFGRPHATVRGWVEQGIEPGGGPLDIKHIHALLDLLEAAAKPKRNGPKLLPVPIGYGPKDRKTYLSDLRARLLP